jgi:hypothetical protein
MNVCQWVNGRTYWCATKTSVLYGKGLGDDERRDLEFNNFILALSGDTSR